MSLKKFISLVLACLMMLTVLVACKKDDEEGEGSEVPENVFIGADEISSYIIIRPDNADEETVSAASKLFFEMKNKFGGKITLTTDYVKDIKDVPTDTKEILVGLTNRAESGGVRYSDTFIGFENERIIKNECDKIRESINNVWFVPSPIMDLLRSDKRYNNFGIHGSGIACAADALAAVQKYVYKEKKVTPERLINALDSDFADDAELLHLLRFEAPKMGTGSKEADELGGMLLSSFADALEGHRNCMGGKWRAGTGTAMYYLWHARELGATADGRRAGEPFGTNFSPSLFAQIPGPITDIESFTANDLTRNMNGGPLTLEFAAGIFNSAESIQKVAMLIQYFIKRGGHQLQLNAVNLEAMKEAQANPEAYRQLVVRIWGWSAYFVELDKDFQDHVMARQEYSV